MPAKDLCDYVTDLTRRLEGVLPLSTLVMASQNETIENLIRNKECHVITTDMDQENAARLMQEFAIVELPESVVVA